MGRHACIALGCVMLLLTATVRRGYAQTITIDPNQVTFTCNSLNTFRNAQTQAFTDQLTFGGLLSASTGLNIRAAGNLTSTTGYNIPLSNFSMTLTTVKIGSSTSNPNNSITLTTTDQTISSGLSVALLSTIRYSFSYRAAGGTGFLVPAGTYSTTITFTSTVAGLPVGNVTATLSVVVTDLASITLQNGGPTATLTFSNAANYTNGVSLTQTSALNAFSNRSYKIGVQASTNLLNGLNSIGIGNIRLQAAANPTNAGITTPQVSLSLSSQNAVTSGIPSLSQDYNLMYSTAAGNGAFLNQPAGTYTTTLTYTITAP